MLTTSESDLTSFDSLDSRNSFERWYHVRSRHRVVILKPSDVILTKSSCLGLGSARKVKKSKHRFSEFASQSANRLTKHTQSQRNQLSLHVQSANESSKLNQNHRHPKEQLQQLQEKKLKQKTKTKKLIEKSLPINSDFHSNLQALAHIRSIDEKKNSSTSSDWFHSKQSELDLPSSNLIQSEKVLFDNRVQSIDLANFDSISSQNVLQPRTSSRLNRNSHSQSFASLIQHPVPTIYSYRIDRFTYSKPPFDSLPSLLSTSLPNLLIENQQKMNYQSEDYWLSAQNDLTNQFISFTQEPIEQSASIVKANVKETNFKSKPESKRKALLDRKVSRSFQELRDSFDVKSNSTESPSQQSELPSSLKQLEIVDENNNLIGFAEMEPSNQSRLVLKNLVNLPKFAGKQYEPYDSEDETVNNMKRFYSREYELRNTHHQCKEDQIARQIQKAKLDREQDQKLNEKARQLVASDSTSFKSSLMNQTDRLFNTHSKSTQNLPSLSNLKSFNRPIRPCWLSMRDLPNPFNASDQAKVNRTMCGSCHSPVFYAENVGSMGRAWHRKCLRCVICLRSLSIGKHAVINGLPACTFPCGIKYQNVPYHYYPGSNESRP